MNRNEIESLVRRASNSVVALDAALLVNGASEWAVAHRLAVYLEPLFPGWNIDCEYNRQGTNFAVKQLSSGPAVRPDITIHHRNRTEMRHNLLAIELKKGDTVNDEGKVREYTAAPTGARNFQYQFGLTVDITQDFALTWFANGALIPDQSTTG